MGNKKTKGEVVYEASVSVEWNRSWYNSFQYWKKIEMLINEIFNRGMPKTYEDYLSEKLNEIEKLNDEMNGVICH